MPHARSSWGLALAGGGAQIRGPSFCAPPDPLHVAVGITKSPRDSAAAPGGVEISFPVTVSLFVMMAVRALDQPAVPGAEFVEQEQPAAVAPQHPADAAHRAVGGQQQQQAAGFDRGDGPASSGSFWHEVSRPQLLQLRQDAISAGDPVVVDAVVAIPARPPPAHLHQPWPDGAGRGADGQGQVTAPASPAIAQAREILRSGLPPPCPAAHDGACLQYGAGHPGPPEGTNTGTHSCGDQKAQIRHANPRTGPAAARMPQCRARSIQIWTARATGLGTKSHVTAGIRARSLGRQSL
jgi:hypothetical protein